MEQTALRDKVLSAAAGKVNPADLIYTGMTTWACLPAPASRARWMRWYLKNYWTPCMATNFYS